MDNTEKLEFMRSLGADHVIDDLADAPLLNKLDGYLDPAAESRSGRRMLTRSRAVGDDLTQNDAETVGMCAAGQLLLLRVRPRHICRLTAAWSGR